jgi:DNA repair exonuclease SbcCD nuclease subunit
MSKFLSFWRNVGNLMDRGSLLGMDGWDMMGERRRVVVVVERRSWDLRQRERWAAMKRRLEFSWESEENCEEEEYPPHPIKPKTW